MRDAQTAGGALAAAIAVALGGCLHARGMAGFPDVEIVGATAVDPERIAMFVCSQAAKELFCRLEDLPDDVIEQQVWRIYATEAGYFDAKAQVSRLRKRGGETRLRIRIEEGRPAHVYQLTLDGFDPLFPEARGWVDALQLGVGGRFSFDAYERAKDGLLAALAGQGYGDATLYSRMCFDDAGVDVRVSFTLAPGERGEPYRFGTSLVSGTMSTPRARVRAAVAEVVRPGDPVDLAKLEAVRERVLELGAFDAVVVKVSRDDERRTIPLVVHVRER